MTDTPPDPIPVGSRVEDRDDEDPDPAVVVYRSEANAADYSIDGTGSTVADLNPDYPSTAAVLLVAFESALDAVDGWEVSTTESIWPLVEERGIDYYAYPEPRLRQIGVTDLAIRRTESGSRYVHRLQITNVGDRLVFGEDYDGVDHGYGTTRRVCFHRESRDLAVDNVVHVEYEREKPHIEDLPPMLVGVESVEVIEKQGSPDFLFDL